MLVQINRLSEDYFNEKGAKDGKPLRRNYFAKIWNITLGSYRISTN